jgi:hypothetical protein
MATDPYDQRRERIIALARTFPTLAREAPLDAWDPFALDEWATTRQGSAAWHAARFVLAVWDTASVHDEETGEDVYPWKCGRFEATRALAKWDLEHRAAFVAWASDPWWP